MGRALLFCAVALAVGCGGESSTEPTATARTARTARTDPASALEPRHGGVLVELEDHVGELVVHASGELHLHVRRGEPVPDAGVTVTVPDEDGAPHAVAMRWADEVQGFVGQLEDATPAPGEAEVLLVRDGHRTRGTARVERVLPPAEHDGSVMSVGEHVVEVVVEPDGRAHLYVLDAPSQRLDVELTLSIAGEDGELHPLALAWDADVEHYTGRIEGLEPQPGPMELILERRGREQLGRGTLLEVALPPPAILGEAGRAPEDFQLEMPALGSDLPAVIPIPPPEEEPEPTRGSEAR
jgi:hypothetical protein